MERVTPLYKVVLLGDEYTLTAPEFFQLQDECEEIARFGKPGKEVYPLVICADSNDPEIKEFQTFHAEKPDGTELELSVPVEEKVEEMKSNPVTRNISPYVKMHEAGIEMKTIKDLMLEDGFCAKGSLNYFAAKILHESTRVTVIKEHEGKSDGQIIDDLIQKNKLESKSKKPIQYGKGQKGE